MKIQPGKQLFFLVFFCLISCSNGKNGLIKIGFLDFITDDTIELAKQGFIKALADGGYVEGEQYELLYANAQGDIPTLGQSCDYILAKDPELIATNVTLSTITASKRTTSVPIIMMVSPTPEAAGLLNEQGEAPANLLGVYETLHYIDTAVRLITDLKPNIKRLATLYNQAEPQSVNAYKRLEQQCAQLGIEILPATITSSAETQLITESLIAKEPDAFFALPDNIIFASFETIERSCARANIPVFTSESGLVRRGAVASFGADFFMWGYQAGEQAVLYLNGNKDLKPELVRKRIKVASKKAALNADIDLDSTFVLVD